MANEVRVAPDRVGLIARLRSAWDGWYNPSSPIPPVAPEGTEPRQFDYPLVLNQQWLPRAGEKIGYPQLRMMADGCYLIRVIIEKMKDRVLSELKRTFRPELLNRIDDVIVFHELSHEEIKQIVDLLMKRVRDQLAEQDMELILSEEAKEVLVKEGYDPVYGARPLRRAIQKLIEDPLSEKILAKEFMPGSAILIGADAEGRITFEKVEAPETGADLVQLT